MKSLRNSLIFLGVSIVAALGELYRKEIGTSFVLTHRNYDKSIPVMFYKSKKDLADRKLWKRNQKQAQKSKRGRGNATLRGK